MFTGVSNVEKLMFTKHLAIMIKAGVPISDAFETLAENTKSPKFREILTKTLSDLQSGKPISKTLSKYPKVFDDFFVNLISISEESGTLEENLEFLSQQLSKDYALRKKIQGAMFYPVLILFAGSAIGLFISLFVLPQLVDSVPLYYYGITLVPSDFITLNETIFKNLGLRMDFIQSFGIESFYRIIRS